MALYLRHFPFSFLHSCRLSPSSWSVSWQGGGRLFEHIFGRLTLNKRCQDFWMTCTARRRHWTPRKNLERSWQNVPFKPCILLTQNWINSLRKRNTIHLKKDEESIIQRNSSHLKGIADIVSSGAKIMSSHGLGGDIDTTFQQESSFMSLYSNGTKEVPEQAF